MQIPDLRLARLTSKISRSLAGITLLYLACSGCSQNSTEAPRPATVAPQPAAPALLSGIVRASSGEPMAGVTVSAMMSGSPVRVSVFSDEKGAYYFPPLQSSGHYVVAAQAIGYERATTELDISSKVARGDFVLQTTNNALPQLSGWEQIMALPERTREQRRGKAILIKSCPQCHQTAKIFAERFDETGWSRIILAMSKGLSSAAPPRANIEAHRLEYARYLDATLGPGAPPLELHIPDRPTGAVALAVTYEYSISNRNGSYPFESGSDWSKGPPIVSGTDTAIHDATVDLAGDVWFTNFRPMPGRTIGRMNGVTGRLTSFGYPGEKPFSTAKSHAMITAHDGTIWFTLAFGAELLKSHLGFMDPKTGEQKVYPVPAGMAAIGAWLTEDGLGNIWAAAGGYTGGEGVLRFDRKTRQFQQFKSISPGMTYGVTGDRQGNGWWAQIDRDIIGHVDMKSGKVSEIRLPFTWQGAPFLKPGDMSEQELSSLSVGIGSVEGNSQMPRRMKADMRSDDLWVADYSGDNVLRINTKTLEMSYYPAPHPGMAPYDVGIDSQHGVWVGLQNGDEVARLEPTTGAWTVYPLPSKGISARSLMVVERAGELEVVVPENDTSKVARMIVRTAADVQALKKKYYQ